MGEGSKFREAAEDTMHWMVQAKGNLHGDVNQHKFNKLWRVLCLTAVWRGQGAGDGHCMEVHMGMDGRLS